MNSERDNELDNLFKNAMQDKDQHIDYREQDWEMMEDMLDSSRKGRVLWLRLASGIAAMLLLVAGWWFLKPSADKVEVAKNTQHQAPVNRGGEEPSAKPQQQEQQVIKEPVITQPIATEQRTEAYVYKGPIYVPKNNTVSTKRTGGDVTDTAITARPPSVTGQIVADNTAKPVDSATTNPAVLAAAGNDTAEVTSPKIKVQPAKGFKLKPVFAISVLASTDVNGVNSFSQKKTGSNVGLMVSATAGRFTISTGAVYAYKPYLTGLANYRNQLGSTSALSQDVSADCRVLDVPLNVDYRFYSKNRNSFSIGTGLSSYFMMKEKYTFNNTGPVSPYGASPAWQSINISGQNRHILGVVNLQATYQRQINSRFGVSIQPFLKLPLTDIGYGEVKLRSAGVAAGLSWKINPKRISGR